jgi:hypothetical protein
MRTDIHNQGALANTGTRKGKGRGKELGPGLRQRNGTGVISINVFFRCIGYWASISYEPLFQGIVSGTVLTSSGFPCHSSLPLVVNWLSFNRNTRWVTWMVSYRLRQSVVLDFTG